MPARSRGLSLGGGRPAFERQPPLQLPCVHQPAGIGEGGAHAAQAPGQRLRPRDFLTPQAEATIHELEPWSSALDDAWQLYLIVGGFPRAVGEFIREQTLPRGLFHGFVFDNTMLRIGSMNMLLHGVENPDIRYRDSLAQDHADEEKRFFIACRHS